MVKQSIDGSFNVVDEEGVEWACFAFSKASQSFEAHQSSISVILKKACTKAPD
eukprot:CAMPEP_0114394804 /NCGR_PEP_ID=MMETSP0102-20121206/12452_1 /TAXON_ID=38822 ORGANISM="Pteridomonas danica, Strain PT" /NCGR_SAMPLE_ID=MMETSP0102 /ASSEMBLY_ACC=CAM_ASM_000212 /LENGTH=52 /DNA_ID=CAMNT_0001554925 /DNA_START=51 /DNA_END=206 /DNA_ORIENTATION=-